jgi:uncharacterized protein
MQGSTTGPWPWYVAGPLIGLVVPVLLVVGGKVFGISSNLRHLCAAVPLASARKPAFLQYDWKRTGGWNLMFALGILLGGALAIGLFGEPDSGATISEATRVDLRAVGVQDFAGLAPRQLFSLQALGSPIGVLFVVVGGFLVGFGTRYAGGCTSGHAISGLAARQLPSLVAVIGFFAGGLLMTHVLFPVLVPLVIR